MTERLGLVLGVLGARGPSRSRVRGSVARWGVRRVGGRAGAGVGGAVRRVEVGATSGGARPKFGVGKSDVWKF